MLFTLSYSIFFNKVTQLISILSFIYFKKKGKKGIMFEVFHSKIQQQQLQETGCYKSGNSK